MSPVANLQKHMDYSEALKFDPCNFKEAKVKRADSSESSSCSEGSDVRATNTMIKREVRSWLPINQIMFNDHQSDAFSFLVKQLTHKKKKKKKRRRRRPVDKLSTIVLNTSMGEGFNRAQQDGQAVGIEVGGDDNLLLKDSTN